MMMIESDINKKIDQSILCLIDVQINRCILLNDVVKDTGHNVRDLVWFQVENKVWEQISRNIEFEIARKLYEHSK